MGKPPNFRLVARMAKINFKKQIYAVPLGEGFPEAPLLAEGLYFFKFVHICMYISI